MNETDDILNDLESLTELFKSLKALKSKFPVPLDCFYKVVVEKINRIEANTKEIVRTGG
jgi:hypothetical protein